MFIPKKTKYKKAQKGIKPKGISIKCNTLHFGSYGIKALESGKITSKQLDIARIAIMKKIKRTGKLWIRVFPDIPVSKKPTEVRMGKGKGINEFWISKIKAGRVLFEMNGISDIQVKDVFSTIVSKLPILTKIIKK